MSGSPKGCQDISLKNSTVLLMIGMGVDPKSIPPMFVTSWRPMMAITGHMKANPNMVTKTTTNLRMPWISKP